MVDQTARRTGVDGSRSDRRTIHYELTRRSVKKATELYGWKPELNRSKQRKQRESERERETLPREQLRGAD